MAGTLNVSNMICVMRSWAKRDIFFRRNLEFVVERVCQIFSVLLVHTNHHACQMKAQREARDSANDNLESMVIPTEFPTANHMSQTDADVQGSLLREYEQKFAERPEQENLTKLCSNAGLPKNIQKRQFFITLDDEALNDLKGSCREKTLPRERVDPWKDEDRPSPGCDGLLSSRTLRC